MCTDLSQEPRIGPVIWVGTQKNIYLRIGNILCDHCVAEIKKYKGIK